MAGSTSVIFDSRKLSSRAAFGHTFFKPAKIKYTSTTSPHFRHTLLIAPAPDLPEPNNVRLQVNAQGQIDLAPNQSDPLQRFSQPLPVVWSITPSEIPIDSWDIVQDPTTPDPVVPLDSRELRRQDFVSYSVLDEGDYLFTAFQRQDPLLDFAQRIAGTIRIRKNLPMPSPDELPVVDLTSGPNTLPVYQIEGPRRMIIFWAVNAGEPISSQWYVEVSKK